MPCRNGRATVTTAGVCRIALSVPLLKYRRATEVKETLLHEMIHAVHFVSNRSPHRVPRPSPLPILRPLNRTSLSFARQIDCPLPVGMGPHAFGIHREREGHGKDFQARMRYINAGICPDKYRPPEGYNLSIRHNFHAEVAHARAMRAGRARQGA